MDEHAVDVASAGGVLRFDVDRHRVLAPSRGSPPRFADSLMRPQDSNSSSSSMIRYQTDDEGVVSQPEYTLTKPSNGPNDRDHLTNHSVIVTFPITPRRGSGWQPLARRRASATNGAAARTCLLPNSASSQSAKNLPPPGPHRRRTAPPAPPRVRRHPPSLACPSAARPRRARRRDRCIAARMQRGLATGDQCYLASNMLATSSEQPRRQTESVCCPLPKTPCST